MRKYLDVLVTLAPVLVPVVTVLLVIYTKPLDFFWLLPNIPGFLYIIANLDEFRVTREINEITKNSKLAGYVRALAVCGFAVTVLGAFAIWPAVLAFRNRSEVRARVKLVA